jgi:uncharacterized membrane protein
MKKINLIIPKVVYFALFATIPSLLSNYVPAIANDGNTGSINILDKENLADLFDIGSGIFAAILATLSLIAYRNLHSKRMLLVSAAFGMFSIHAIVTSIDAIMPTIESSVLELIVSVVIFVSLTFFFLAIIKKPEINERELRLRRRGL